MLFPIILSGGAGSRLWPASRQARPKPFMTLPDGECLLAKTLKRVVDLPGVSNVLTVTNRDLFFSTRDTYEETTISTPVSQSYLLEPVGRNTAPAIAMAAFHQTNSGHSNDPMLVLPADHLIDDQDAFASAVEEAMTLAADGYLVTFGIKPGHAETGFGYIQSGDSINGGSAHRVSQFVEKPDQETAEAYVSSGDYLWNSGMFCFTPQAYLDVLKEHAPAIFESAEACWKISQKRTVPMEFDEDSFAAIPDDSVDYAVMENADKVAVVECDPGWSDIGSWDAMAEQMPADENGNRVYGEAIQVNSKNCYIQSDRLIATVGVEDLIIVDTGDAVMVAARNASQDVKKVVAQLKANGDPRFELHQTVHRPWGTYTVLEEGANFKMKRIVVYPGSQLSLQMHHHRSEHWIVVSGTAEVVNGDDEFLVRTNESTYIPVGNNHRLTNPGVVDLVMIEVQSGTYLEEDDIVRFEDVYGRA